MSDIRTVWDAAVAHGDWVLSEGALLTGGDLATVSYTHLTLPTNREV